MLNSQSKVGAVHKSPSIRYPRRQFVRAPMRLAGRALMRALTRTTIIGLENLPKEGPLILVGNHVALLEAVMMVLYAPWYIELIGTGEIPLDPRYAPLIHAYGFIPIKRGEGDRRAMSMALDVLKQRGVVGIFPEGGIWESAFKRARTGVAWLSYHANAPVVPIGFGGIDGALAKAFRFKRPHVSMNIGHVIPPIQEDGSDRPLKVILEEGANAIMRRVEALVPEEDKQRWNRINDERFELELRVERPDGLVMPLPPELTLERPDMLAKFFHRPLLLDVMARNLRLPVQALQRIDVERDPRRLADAAQTALNYLDQNPHFLTYRFGNDQGKWMRRGLVQLRDIGRWAASQGYRLALMPIRRYRRRGSDEEIVERRVGELPPL